MCYSPSYKEQAEIALANELAGDGSWVDYLRSSEPGAYAMYLELKRDRAFQRDAAAALEAGWPSDEDLAGLVGSERTALLMAANLRLS